MKKFTKNKLIGWIVAPLLVGLLVGMVHLFIEYNVFVPNNDSSKNFTSLPNSAVIIKQTLVQVPAKEYWHDTGIEIQKGDWLEFIATGSWWSGISMTGPEGDGGVIFGLGRPTCGECPVPDGNLGELVGKVDDGLRFRIGRSAIHVIDRDGNLFLAMNENTGSCNDGPEGSCYEDNNGALNVTVTVRRIK